MTYLCDCFPCLACDAKGFFEGSGNDPRSCRYDCDECGGSGAVDASEYLDQCLTQIMVCRNLFHMNWKGNRVVAWNYHAEADKWLQQAKLARASLLEAEHAGSNHINRAA